MLHKYTLISFHFSPRVKHYQRKQLKSSFPLSVNSNQNHSSSSLSMRTLGGKITKISARPTRPDWLRFLRKLMIGSQVSINQCVQWCNRCLLTDYSRHHCMLHALFLSFPSKDSNVLAKKELRYGIKSSHSFQEAAAILRTMLFYCVTFSWDSVLRPMCVLARTLKGLTLG